MKTCTKCGEEKPLEEYPEHSRVKKDGTRTRRTYCKKCFNALHSTPEQKRKSYLKYAYGLTPEEYDEKLSAQAGGCMICGQQCRSKKVLSVDHNKDTGEVRDLLCNDCNLMIGFAHEDRAILIRGVQYLERWGR